MAVDTRSKRASVVSLFVGFSVLAPPLPDAALDQGDRQHIAWSYGGILATAPVAFVGTDGFVLVKNTAIARGAEWRGALPSLIPFNLGNNSFVAPIAVTEFRDINPQYRAATIITGVRFARLIVNVKTGLAGHSGAIQYSTDEGVSWDYLDGASGPLADCGSAGFKVGAWAALDALATGDAWIRLVTGGGDGTTTVQWYNTYVEFSYVEA